RPARQRSGQHIGFAKMRSRLRVVADVVVRLAEREQQGGTCLPAEVRAVGARAKQQEVRMRSIVVTLRVGEAQRDVPLASFGGMLQGVEIVPACLLELPQLDLQHSGV